MSNNPDLNGESQTRKNNPPNIPPEIMDHVFDFLKLSLSDIKNCRLVCRQWNQVAVNFLQKLTVVNISNSDRFEEFNQEFPNAEQSQIFTCFRLVYFKWPVNSVVAFFEKRHNNFSEIELLWPDFGLDKENQTYDLSPLLPSTLIKLQISCTDPKMILTTDKICNIRILELKGCILNIVPGTTLNTVELDLDVTFYKNEEKINNFLINPLLNFNVLKKATFRGKNISLDLQGSHSLDLLSLQTGVTVLNLETSNWEIKKLCFRVYPLRQMESELSMSQIKYKQLKTTLTHLNVSLLPRGIKKLQVSLLSGNWAVPPRISGEHKFPDLNHLHISLHTGTDFSPFVAFFKHCPNLTVLTVSSSCGDNIILNTSSLPPSVETLRVICGVRIIVDRSLQMKSLAVFCPHLDNVVVKLAKELHVKNLYLLEVEPRINCSRYRNLSDNGMENFFKSLLDLKLDNFVLSFYSQVNNSDFQKSFLFPHVDTQAKYYLFQRGGKGKAISHRDLKHI